MSEELKKIEETFIKCGELVLMSVLVWTVGRDGFKEKLETSDKFSRKWYKDNFNKRDQKRLDRSEDIENFDISLLYLLILFLSGMEDPQSDSCTQGFAKKIYKIKNLRNNFIHRDLAEDEKTKDVTKWYQYLKQLFTEVLTEVGKFKSIDQNIIDKKVNECTKELSCLQNIKRDTGSTQVRNTKGHTNLHKNKKTVRDDGQLFEFLQDLRKPDLNFSDNVMLRFDAKPLNISHLDETVHLLSNHKDAEVGLWLDYQYFSKISEECSDSLIQKLTESLISFKGRVNNFSLLPSNLRQIMVKVKPEEIPSLNNILPQQRSLWNLVISIECKPGQAIMTPTLDYNHSNIRKQLGIRLSSELEDTHAGWAVTILTNLCPPTRDRHLKYWATSLAFWETHLTAEGIKEIMRLLKEARFSAPQNSRNRPPHNSRNRTLHNSRNHTLHNSRNQEPFLEIRTSKKISTIEKEILNKCATDFNLGEMKIRDQI